MKWLRGMVAKIRKATARPDWQRWQAHDGGNLIAYRCCRKTKRIQKCEPGGKWIDYIGPARPPKE